MTLEQSVKLKEMGFPRNEGEWFYDSDGEFLPNPTAEEALAWVAGKLTENGFLVNFLISKRFISAKVIKAITNEIKFIEIFYNLSDAVYALIVWAYENKLLEGK